MENVFYPSEINQLKERINNRTSLSPCSYNVGERNILQILLSLFFKIFFYFFNALQSDYNSSNMVYFLTARFNLCSTAWAKMNPKHNIYAREHRPIRLTQCCTQ